MKKTPKPTMTFEEGMHALKLLVEQLESGKLPLTESILAYEKGKEYVALLDGLLLQGEKRLELYKDGIFKDITSEVDEAKEG